MKTDKVKTYGFGFDGGGTDIQLKLEKNILATNERTNRKSDMLRWVPHLKSF